MKNEKVIIGIDPGTNIMGYGIIAIETKKETRGQLINKSNKIELIELDVIKLDNLSNQALKLKEIFERTLKIIDENKPDELAIEAPFYGKNIQSMLKLGRAQGVAMAAALFREIPITEYSPRKIKQSITGNGNASKEQVSAMLISILKIKEKPKYLDATDGLAVAVCHSLQGSYNRDFYELKPGREKSSGWKAFISNNPERIRK